MYFVEDEKPRKDKPDEALLKKLLVACDDYDMDTVEEIVAELGQYEYVTDNDLIIDIVNSAKQFDFTDIIDRIRKRGE